MRRNISSSTSSSSSTTTSTSTFDARSESSEEQGVSVMEKNGILRIVLEIVEGGGWRGGYEKLEKVVGRLEEEGEKKWRERRMSGVEGVYAWKEMGRLAHQVGYEIKKREEEEKRFIPITLLDATTVTIPQNERIQREGNIITHHAADYSRRNCFIGGVMTSV